MITRVEARQYRCLQSVQQEVGPFQVLIGPNGSGKSVFLDVVRFLSTFMSSGLKMAIEERTSNFYDLVWRRDGSCFELAIEAAAPTDQFHAQPPSTIRYELGVKIDARSDIVSVSKETVTLRSALGNRPIINRDEARAVFRTELPEQSEASNPPPPADLSALGNVDERFPHTARLRELLQRRIQTVVLDDMKLRFPSPPGQGAAKILNGSNLAQLVLQLQENPERFDWWIAHVQIALPDLDSIRTVLRPEDNHRYLMLMYKNGVELPSWVVSDGTLRLLALTILAYLPDFKGIYLIEEPETGVHPTALETIYQSLSSVYDGQVLVTSHSPILLNLPKLEELLCFQKASEGTEVIRGDAHPALREWKGSVSLGQLFAAGVLG